MTKKHKQFFATREGRFSDNTEVQHYNGKMAICVKEGVVFITKQEAMDFFGLMEKPEPKKPFYAELIKAHIMGEVIECRYELWQPSTHWELLSNADSHIAAAFLGEEEDRRYSFRIKSE